MRVAMIREFGGPEVFELRQVATPEPGPGEVLVRVMATSVNPVDCQIRRAGAWAGVRPPAVIGYDVSGVVEAIGSGVRDFRVGDEVFYTPEILGGAAGSYAEYHVAREAIVARKPGNLSHLEAAVVPLAGGTAWEALIARGRLRVGERVFVHGGAGGVGHFAVQIGRAAGAYVFATAAMMADNVACGDGTSEGVGRKGGGHGPTRGRRAGGPSGQHCRQSQEHGGEPGKDRVGAQPAATSVSGPTRRSVPAETRAR